MAKKILGVIGGMGPAATALFMRMIVERTRAARDGEHIETYILNCPGIPDRTEYILEKSADSPVPCMVSAGRRLAALGAEVIAVPCVTAYAFYDELAEGIPVPVINPVYETAKYLKNAGVRSAEILATDGTVRSGIFARAFAREGITAIFPKEDIQRGVMRLIYDDVKAGHLPDDAVLHRVGSVFESAEAGCVVLGCTELSVIRRQRNIKGRFLDVMEILANSAVAACGELKSEYAELIIY